MENQIPQQELLSICDTLIQSGEEFCSTAIAKWIRGDYDVPASPHISGWLQKKAVLHSLMNEVKQLIKNGVITLPLSDFEPIEQKGGGDGSSH